MNRPAVDVMDETFVVAARSELARRFRDPALWRQWWPRLSLVETENRGDEGVRWSVGGELVGTAEIWLEPWRDGVRVHWMLRCRLGERRAGLFGRSHTRHPERVTRAYVTSFKSRIHALKDELERGRAVGGSRATS